MTKRHHPASAARILSAGAATSGTLLMVALMASEPDLVQARQPQPVRHVKVVEVVTNAVSTPAAPVAVPEPVMLSGG